MSIDPIEIQSALSKFFLHFFNMHRWQKALFTLSVVLFSSGTAGKITSFFNQPATTAVTTTVDGSPRVQNSPPAPEPSMTERISPWAMRVGGSVLVGFILGMALRVFIRITATILVVGLAIMMLLSRYNVVNVDLSAAETKYENSIHWAQDQATRLKDAVLAHVPSSGGGAFGVFAGFRRRRLPV